MDDEQLLRYSRHIFLPEISIEGQESLFDSTVLVVGVGGLGSSTIMYLTAAGVGKLILCDHDVVDLSNLQRQIIHGQDDIGKLKVNSANEKLVNLNPHVTTQLVSERLSESNLMDLIMQADAVVDCTDNFATRHLINRYCVLQHKPLISGSAIRFEGQVSVFDLRHANNPCYHCLFPDTGHVDDIRCAATGVFAPIVGIVGAIQAAETLKLLMEIGTVLSGRLLTIDALTMECRTLVFNQDPSCSVCHHTSF